MDMYFYMATLYQLHSSMDMLRRSTAEMARTWRAGDSILLLGATVAFADWLDAYLGDCDIRGITAIYALQDDIDALNMDAKERLNLSAKIDTVLSDSDWVTLTQNDAQFDNVVTLAL